MRVLVVGINYWPEPTGIAPYTFSLCNGLVARRHRVRVITAMPHYPQWRIRSGYEGLSRTEYVGRVPVHRLRHYVPSQPNGMRRLVSELSFGVRAMLVPWGRPDVVVLVSPALFATALAMVPARLRGLPTVVWVQDVYSLGVVETAERSRPRAVARVVARVESRVLRSAGGVVVIHDRLGAVAEHLGVAPSRVRTIRNWAHVAIGPQQERRAARRALGWHDDEIVALHSGAMGRKQDLGNVIAAARLAERQGRPVRFVLMGDGGERTSLEAAAQGIAAVEIIDPLPDDRYPAALVAADVLLVNEHRGQREMAVPSKLTSYFSSGRPVVAATERDSVTASELAAAGAGVRVDPGEPEALLNAVIEVGGDPDRAEQLGRLGQAYRERVLSEGVALDRWSAWLREVVGRSGAQRARRTALPTLRAPFIAREATDPSTGAGSSAANQS